MSSKHLAQIAGVALVYFGAAKFGMSLAFATKQVTAVWPPTGVAFVALVLLGYRVWPGIYLGAFLANLTANESVVTAAGISVGNTLAVVLSVWLVKRLGSGQLQLARPRDVVAFVLGGAALACMVSATSGVANLVLGGIVPRTAFWSVWWVWWIGDALGVLLLSPFLLAWLTPRSEAFERARAVELGALLAALCVLCRVVFAEHVASTAQLARYEYTVFPLIIWAAVRFGQREAASVGVLISGFAVWGAIHDRGPFASGGLDERLMLLDVFMGIVMTTALTLSAAVAQRRAAERALEGARVELEDRVRERTAELAGTNAELALGRARLGEANEQLRTLNASLQGSLKEREVLLQEIHHRVKNNLQVISSLINMQIRRLEAEEDREALEECRARVQAIALIHEKLYQSSDYARVPFAEYAESLASSVFQAYRGVAANVRLDLAIDDVALAVDQAIPCGLILNELITNALKHGFPDGQSGTIRVRLQQLEPGALGLTVENDGAALPLDFEARSRKSLGLQLVTTLAKQLGGMLEVQRRPATSFVLRFAARS